MTGFISEYDKQKRTIEQDTAKELHAVLVKAFSQGSLVNSRYQIVGYISKDSVTVFLGLDLKTLSKIILKAYPPKIQIMSSLDHPSLLKALDIQQTPINTFIIMELMKENLVEYVKRNPEQRISSQKTKELTQTLLQILCYLQSLKLVYRDLQPSSILLDNKEQPKLTHFGLMKALSGIETCDENGMYYSAPEVFARTVTISSDMWSLGCVIAYLLQTEAERKKPLFYGSDPLQILSSMVKLCGKPPMDVLHRITIDYKMSQDGIDLMYNLNKLEEGVVDLQASLTERISLATPLEIDLLCKLLVFHPSYRLTADEALAHAYFAQSTLSAPLINTDSNLFN